MMMISRIELGRWCCVLVVAVAVAVAGAKIVVGAHSEKIQPKIQNIFEWRSSPTDGKLWKNT